MMATLENVEVPAAPHRYTTREEWLLAFAEIMRPLFAALGTPLPEKLRMSCGFPKGSRKAIGQAFYARCSEDGTREIFVHPAISDPVTVALISAHELIHTALPDGTGHGAEFKKIALALGFETPIRELHATEEMTGRMKAIVDRLGPYPHSALLTSTMKKQRTRLLKMVCPQCGMIIRVALQSVMRSGPPLCSCNSVSPTFFEFAE